ncbi:M12 family metallopeptidase [Paludibacterium paludis]|uniref:Peptidase metallopeptidase domain-containing protein n=1 Tax=Paludibacterium paludis TaxID=1225769 RepID=A0A918P1N4_9NEIS|nr:M12 family metallopeptidase [Paludibacterium paludis]GGY12523.1 hypothetical protein GCM10011289_14670 [Paludibacterium paludis]
MRRTYLTGLAWLMAGPAILSAHAAPPFNGYAGHTPVYRHHDAPGLVTERGTGRQVVVIHSPAVTTSDDMILPFDRQTLDTEGLPALASAAPTGQDGRYLRQPAVRGILAWENAVVPYRFSEGYPADARLAFEQAAERYRQKTGIRFARQERALGDYVRVRLDPQRTSAVLGWRGGRQDLSLTRADSVNGAVLIHMMAHALGLVHDPLYRDISRTRAMHGDLDAIVPELAKRYPQAAKRVTSPRSPASQTVPRHRPTVQPVTVDMSDVFLPGQDDAENRRDAGLRKDPETSRHDARPANTIPAAGRNDSMTTWEIPGGRPVRLRQQGNVMVSGDMVVGSREDVLQQGGVPQLVNEANGQDTLRAPVRDGVRKWHLGVVPYRYAAEYPGDGRRVFEEAAAWYGEQAGIRFRPAVPGDRHVLELRQRGHCDTRVGRSGGIQPVNMTRECALSLPATLHAMAHTLGLAHGYDSPETDRKLADTLAAPMPDAAVLEQLARMYPTVKTHLGRKPRGK